MSGYLFVQFLKLVWNYVQLIWRRRLIFVSWVTLLIIMFTLVHYNPLEGKQFCKIPNKCQRFMPDIFLAQYFGIVTL